VLGQGACDLGCDRLGADALLQRCVERGAIVQATRFRIVGTELDRSREHALGTHRVAATKQYLAEEAMGRSALAAHLARLRQRRLRLGEQVGIEIHAPDGEHHVRVVHVPGARALANLTDEIVVLRRSQIGTERDG
jgi:hypothetical protein